MTSNILFGPNLIRPWQLGFLSNGNGLVWCLAFLGGLYCGFFSIPYKVFTIAAGVMSMALAPFVLALAIDATCSFSCRGVDCVGGDRMEAALHKYVDRLGWATVGLVGVGILAYQ